MLAAEVAVAALTPAAWEPTPALTIQAATEAKAAAVSMYRRLVFMALVVAERPQDQMLAVLAAMAVVAMAGGQ